MADWVTYWLPVGFVLIAALGLAAGWILRRRLEGQHGRAVEASAHEFVLAAGRARDRARSELEELESRYKMLRSEHRQCAPEIKSLKGTCAELQARLDCSREKSGDDRTAAELPGKRPGAGKRATPVGVLKPAGRTSRTKRSSDSPAFVLRAPDGPKDDLKAIRGIGPGLEQALNALGVFHYSQLAGLTGKEIDWLGQRLGAFPGRIRKDGWPQQARRLFASSPAKPAKPVKRKRRGKAKHAGEIGA